MLEFSEIMLETWPQFGLQAYLAGFYYFDVRLASISQILSLSKSIFILVPLTLKAIMPENTFMKNPQETWIIAIKRMVWVTLLWLAMGTILIENLANSINFEQPIFLWILSSSSLICGSLIIMSFGQSGYGRLKCYMVSILFLQIGILRTYGIIAQVLQNQSFKHLITYYLDDSGFAMLSTLIVIIFAKAANSIKNMNGNIKFIEENPEYMIFDDFEMISRVVISIGLKSTSKIPNIYFCSLIMIILWFVCCIIIENL